MNNSKAISTLIGLIGVVYLLSLIGLNPFVIKLLTTNELHYTFTDNIQKVQIWVSITGVLSLAFGIVSGKLKLFDFANEKNKLTNVIIAISFLIATLIYVEFALRIKPVITTADLFDKSIPYVNSVFSRHVHPNKTVEINYFEIPDKVNYRFYKGYHTNPFEFEKPKGEIRIVVLGGSFIFGDHEVANWDHMKNEYDRNWIEKAETKLHLKGYINVEVINAGTPGHATFDSFGRLYSEIYLFEPDYVILCHAWNDIKYFSQITPNNSLLRQFKGVRQKTRADVYSTLEEISQIYVRGKRIFQFENIDLEGTIVKQGVEVKITPYAKKQFKLTLDLFNQACKSIGATPVLLTQPRLIHLNNSESERNRIGYSAQKLNHEGICDAFAFTDSVVMSYVNTDSLVACYDFAKQYIGVDSLFHDHVHLNATGNQIRANASKS
ncbi:MAG: hypothetical protein HRT71_05570 [Flavobacteriales bacterium]|nr:hypothetical protein [Flavobacteriales bacterium]